MATKKFEHVVIRSLTVVSLCSYCIWIFYRWAFWDWLDADLQQLLHFDALGSYIPSTNYTYLPFFAASVISYVGIFFIKRWGLNLLVAIYGATLLLSVFSGAQIHSPVERIFYAILLLSDGMILGLGFFCLTTDFFPRSRKNGSSE